MNLENSSVKTMGIIQKYLMQQKKSYLCFEFGQKSIESDLLSGRSILNASGVVPEIKGNW